MTKRQNLEFNLSTLYMIKHYDELNKLIKDQQRYRDNQVARDRARALSRRNRAQQYRAVIDEAEEEEEL